MSYRELRQRRVLLTGASSGIGLALARRLATEGCHLLLTARREDRLSSLTDQLRRDGVEVSYVAGDLTSEQVREQLLTEVSHRWSALDLLINNAGVGAVGPFASADSLQLQRIMDVNFLAPAELTRRMLPSLQVGQQPLVVNIGSVLGHVAVPNKSEYCASKFALRGWSNALRIELQRAGMDLLLVDPNTTQSEFFDQLLAKQGNVARNPWSMKAETVADRIVRAIRNGRRELVLTTSARAMIWLDFLLAPCFRAVLRRWG